MKVEFQNTVTYVIDEEHRTIKATIKNTKNDVANIISKLFKQKGVVCETINYEVDFILKNSYTGIATCQEPDTFDVEKGKKIARKKAIIKYNQDKIKAMKRIYNYLIEINTALNSINDILEETINYNECKKNKFEKEISSL